MSTYPNDGAADPSTPLYDQTAQHTALRLDVQTAGQDGPDGGSRPAPQHASGQAADAVEDTAAQGQQQAKQVGAAAADAGQRVASTTKDQASRVATDAIGQARDLYGKATEQLSEQASKQQQSAAALLHTVGGDLSRMHDQADGGGLAAELVGSLADRVDRTARWLEDRQPDQVLDEVRQFAARRPGLFIGLAAVTGIVAARATKALVTQAKPDASGDGFAGGAR